MSAIPVRRWIAGHPVLFRLLRETLLVGVLFLLYNAGRRLAAGQVDAAFANADEVWALERWLHLPREQTLQDWALQWPDLVRTANDYYSHVHFPLTFAVLVFLVLRRPQVYSWVRTALVLATATSLVIYFVLPVAPPRMMTELGFVDTGILFGQSVYSSEAGSSMANQLAAVPSLHVGWALLVAVAMITATTSRWRWLWLAHPVLTVLVVVLTGNHYWIDGIAGAGLVITGLVLSVRWARRNPPSEPEPLTSPAAQPVTVAP